jgi:hypothetical protein
MGYECENRILMVTDTSESLWGGGGGGCRNAGLRGATVHDAVQAITTESPRSGIT